MQGLGQLDTTRSPLSIDRHAVRRATRKHATSHKPQTSRTRNPSLLSQSFNDLAKNPGLDLYPPHLRGAIDAANEWIYPQINNGVYRCAR